MSDRLFAQLEQSRGLPSGLLDAVWSAESGRGRHMTSKAGAQGHFQFMPATAKEQGVTDPNDLAQSARGAADYLSRLLKRSGGDVEKTLAAYNWGMGNVERQGMDKAPQETRDYIAKIMPQVNGKIDREKVQWDEPAIDLSKVQWDTPKQAATTKQEPSFASNLVGGLKKSVLDTGQGLKQLVDSGATAIASTGVGRAVDEFGQKYLGLPSAQQGAQVTQNAVDARRIEEKPLMDTWGGNVGNIAGSVAQMVVPGLAMGKASAARNLLLTPKTAAQAGGVGSLFGGVQATAADESRLGNMALGAAGGAGGYGLAKGAGVILGKIPTQSKLLGASQRADEMIVEAAKTAGIKDLALLDPLKAEVREALRTGKLVDKEELARTALFQKLDIPYLRAQVTRDPSDYAKTMNLRGIDMGGTNPISEILGRQHSGLQTAVEKMAGSARGEFETGAAMIRRLKERGADSKAAVDVLYQSARDSSGRSVGMNTKYFSERSNQLLDEGMLGRFLPDNVKGLLNDVSTGKIPLDVGTAVQIDSVLSQAASRADPASQKAIGVIRKALNETGIDDAAGEGTKAAFDTARKAAAARFNRIDNSPAFAGALDDAAPDKFVKQHVFAADVRSLKATLSELGTEEAGAVKAEVNARLSAALQKGQASYKAEIGRLGKQKLALLYTPDEVSRLSDIASVAALIQKSPPGAAVNTSNTAASLMNMLGTASDPISQFLRLPVLNLARDSVKKYSNEKAVNAFSNNKLIVRKSAQPVKANPLLAPSGGSASVDFFGAN